MKVIVYHKYETPDVLQ